MDDRLLRGEPQLGVGTHEAADEVFGLLTDVAPEVVVEVIPSLDNLPEEFGLGLVLLVLEEGRVAAEHDVGDDPTGPEVLGPARLCLTDHLRREVSRVNIWREAGSYLRGEVGGGATDRRLLVKLFFILGQTEVHHHYLGVVRIVVEQEVFRLEISVNDSSRV